VVINVTGFSKDHQQNLTQSSGINNMPMGHNMIGYIMPKLSEKAGLSEFEGIFSLSLDTVETGISGNILSKLHVSFFKS
jgi:hypothetical protein